MPLVDRAAIRQEVGRLGAWLLDGVVKATTSAGSTTTLTDSTLYSSVRDQHVRNRSVVNIIEAGGTNDVRGQRRYATGPPSTAGTITVSPAFSLTVDTTVDYEVWDADGPHPDIVDQCIDRALARLCWYWRAAPLSAVHGDFESEISVSSNNLVDTWSTTLWTGTSVTTTLQSLAPPDEFTRRVVRIQASATPGYLQSQTLSVDPDFRQDWFVQCLARTTGASDEASIVPYDVTNAAAITADDTNTWDRIGWGRIYTSFTLPATCEQLAFRLQATTSGDICEFAAIQAFPLQQRTVSLPRRIASKRHVGPVFERWGTYYGEFRRVPWNGSLERREATGRGVTLELEPPVGNRSLWFYEKASFPALTSATPVGTDDDTETWASLEWVAQAALVECYRHLRDRDWKEYPNRWDDRLMEAEGRLVNLQADYGIEPMLTNDSPVPQGPGLLRV